MFELKDKSFVKGGVGFGLNGINFLLIDKFKIIINECAMVDDSLNAEN